MNSKIRAMSLLMVSATTSLVGADLNMEFSGSNVYTMLDIVGEGKGTAQDSYATGKGSLGQFTLRTVDQTDVIVIGPGTSGGCSDRHEIRYLTGVLILVFEDGSQIHGELKEGHVCHDFPSGKGTYVQTFVIIGGMRRFSAAKGEIRLEGTYALLPARVNGSRVVSAFEGKVTGTISD